MPYKDKEKQREFQRLHLRRRRQEWIDRQGGRCVECGATEALEIDHIYPALKSVSVSAIWSRRAEVREAELAKCQVLCHDCHLEKTMAQVRRAEHGTHSRYVKGCRCKACRAAHRELAAEYRAAGRSW